MYDKKGKEKYLKSTPLNLNAAEQTSHFYIHLKAQVLNLEEQNVYFWKLMQAVRDTLLS